MSEIVQPASDKPELPKWDRSAKGVYNAVGRIADKLYTRADRVSGVQTDKGSLVERNDRILPYDGWHRKSVQVELSAKPVRSSHETEKVWMSKSTGNSHIPDHYLLKFSRYDRGGSSGDELMVKVTSDTAEAGFGINNKGPSITSSVTVGRVAANILGQIRGGIAEAELSVGQQMIDFVNGKKIKK